MSEADDRYLAEVIEDCKLILGNGIELIGLEREDGQEVRLVARYRLGDTTWVSTGTGETVIAAHANLRPRLVFDRVRLGFTAMIDSGPGQGSDASRASVAASGTPPK